MKEATEITNVRGTLNNLEVGQVLKVDLDKYKASYLRSVTASLKVDTCKVFTSKLTGKREMTITRVL